MFRSTLSLLAALILLIGISTTAQAEVSGSFNTYFIMFPDGTQTDAVEFFFDIQSYLEVYITLSGLTLGFDTGFGPTGVEFAIINFDTFIGALQLDAKLIFAEPFGCTLFADPVGNEPDANVVGQCPGPFVVPLGDGNGDGVLDREVGFVAQRLETEINIAGITLNNLAIFEDVDFPDIQGRNPVTGATNDHEHDHFNGTVLYDLSGFDGIVDNQTPTFGFGDVISISGQTVSGITVSGSTALCSNPMLTLYIKKRNFPTEVNKACTSQFGNNAAPLEGGAKTPLVFEKETLSVEGVQLGGILLNFNTIFLPLNPIATVIDASFNLFNLADVTAQLSSDNITSLSLDQIVITISSPNLVISLVDLGGDLTIDATRVVFNVIIPNFDLTFVLQSDTSGLTFAEFSAGSSFGGINFHTTTTFRPKGGPVGQLTWDQTSFGIHHQAGPFNFGGWFKFSTMTGLEYIKFKVGVDF